MTSGGGIVLLGISRGFEGVHTSSDAVLGLWRIEGVYRRRTSRPTLLVILSASGRVPGSTGRHLPSRQKSQSASYQKPLVGKAVSSVSILSDRQRPVNLIVSPLIFGPKHSSSPDRHFYVAGDWRWPASQPHYAPQ